jgi:hypothetical protein
VQDLILGLVAIAAGALFCFAGYLAFRLIIPLWGFFAGFAFGAGLIASVTGDGFLRTLLGWAVGLGCALVFALLAYLFYEVAVVVAMGSIGFALGTSIMVALHVSWTWLIVLGGVAVGVLLALGAIVAELPMVLLIVLSALGGASAITMGVMLLVGTTDSADFTSDSVTEQIDAGWWWYVVYGALALAGMVTQLRGAARIRGSMREAWAADRA